MTGRKADQLMVGWFWFPVFALGREAQDITTFDEKHLHWAVLYEQQSI